jgi:hypothetical protein
MNVVPLFPLGPALQARSDAIARRVREHIGDHFWFLRTSNGLRVTYVWCRSFVDAVDVVPVGDGRFGIIRCGKFVETVQGGRALLRALRDYRRGAAIALEDRREAENAAEWRGAL